ncbi:16S rRNA (cytidine(1402)-2'-O)-methyltransferase [Oceanobacillus indicireducens]|uniref:Ribosomal RNA small subunit methyltransferase I n=1 Tax=Oceanobacillus indicireducens TaxID=1004261 RepID=A0A917XXW3_9BACI|nr:16S rRNA (cytidine(1402)-2'-O)-methyltransferase [Oceanobacillus indicireducens]GGN57980.1 ribosomal RNA small subunit methyltransferase I [Oceanobacillus indicireducens]
MMIQKSFANEIEGAIILVPTPIGNLEDITYRALNTLKTATVIAAEDTRNTRKLLNYFEITTPLTSYHEYTKKEKIEKLINEAERGAKIAVVSDAGMPAISDPGTDIVEAALERNIKVIVLPGANAALSALVGSGLSTNEFYFYGFLPRKKKEMVEVLERLRSIPATLLFYESPFRVKQTLNVLHETLGNREIALARELTKRFEEYIRGTMEEVLTWTETNELKGEFVIVVEGASEDESDTLGDWWTGLDMKEHVEHYMDKERLSSKEAIKQTAVDRGIPKREVYQNYHIQK